MTLNLLQVAVLFFAAMIAGALNSVAGGGSFISFPALTLVGVTPKLANATNTMALWPGSVASVGAYREEIRRPIESRIPLLIISFIGGAIGAYLLLVTPESTFGLLLPWLLLFALLLFIFGKNLSAKLKNSAKRMNIPAPVMVGAVLAAQLFVSVYGGFFGGGIGIMMLAVLSLAGMEDIHHMNGIKTLLASVINGVAVFVFLFAREILFPHVLIMIVGAILGGYFGAYYARKFDPKVIRNFVIVVGTIMTVLFFIRAYFPA
jgi:uncharacterized protein